MCVINETCIIRPNLLDLNLVELNYYQMISLDKCNESCNALDDLSTKICVPNETKDVNVKVFNIIKRIYEGKALIKHISCNCKCKLNSTTCNSYHKWSKCQGGYRKHRATKKEYSWHPSTCICE